MKKVLILHSGNLDPDRPDENDTFEQVKKVEESLSHLGLDTVRFHFQDDFSRLEKFLKETNSDMVFNLVETVNKTDRLIYTVTSFLDFLGVPYTGCSTQTMILAASKIKTKKIMRTLSLPTSDWFSEDESFCSSSCSNERWIVKSDTEHGSLGLDTDNVVYTKEAALKLIDKKQIETQSIWFAEKYIDGREFNVSILGSKIEAYTPMIAEIVYENYPDGVPKIQDYKSKWDKSSFGYKNSYRNDLPFLVDDTLKENICNITKLCAQAFSIDGPARIEFRVDSSQNPYILEINPNPCLLPDIGLIAAISARGMSYIDLIEKMIKKDSLQNI